MLLISRVEKLSIVLIVLFGSIMTGVRYGFDIDILVLLSDTF